MVGPHGAQKFMKVANHCIVSISYTLTNDSGECLDRSPDDEPLVYLHGAVGVLPALAAALEGKAVGEAFDVTVTPAEGFGEHEPARIQTVPRSAFSDPQALEVGTQVNVRTEEGEQPVIITAVDEHRVTIDGNHPLAGLTLRFEGVIVDIRAASAAEIRHWPDPAPAGEDPAA